MGDCPVNPHSDEPCACLHPESLPPGCLNACSAIHHHFGLSYAAYLVLPRSVLQSMPREWQARFVGLLNELGEVWDGPEGDYKVELGDWNDSDTRPAFTRKADPLADYQRGRRKVELKT